MEDLLTGEYLLYKSLCGIDFGVHLIALWARRTLPIKQTYHLGQFPLEWNCASALDRLLKEEYVERKGGIVCFRSDRRSPDEIFKYGFDFEASVASFTRLYCCDLGGDVPTAGCCVASLTFLTYATATCCCILAPYLLATQCTCILCSYFNVNRSYCSPYKLCAMHLAQKTTISSASTLSFAKQAEKAQRYPMGVITTQPGGAGYLYLCYVPAPYVNMDKLAKKSLRGKSREALAIGDDTEVFPLGAPVLDKRYIIGAWGYESEEELPVFTWGRIDYTRSHCIQPSSFTVNPASDYYPHAPKWPNTVTPAAIELGLIEQFYKEFRRESMVRT